MSQWLIIDAVLNFNQSTFYIKYEINKHILTTYYFKFISLGECHSLFTLHTHMHADICRFILNLHFII